jgi:putative peptidoglycan lipid II flippase
MTAVAAMAAAIAPWLVRTILAPGFAPWQQALTVELMRWMLISTVLFGISGIVMGVLNSFQHFLLPALAPILYNVSIIAGAWFLAPKYGVFGLVLGVIIGAALHLDCQLLGLWWYGARYTPTLGLKNPKVVEVGKLMGPRVIGLAAVQVNFWVNTLLASSLATGSIAALNYAWLLMLLPQGIVAQGVATAAFPTFASLQAQGRLDELRRTVTSTLKAVLFLSIPAAVGLLTWGTPLIRVLLERGEFTPQSTSLTATALTFYSIGLIGHSAVEILARAFYALHDTKTPVIIGVSTMALNVVLSLLLRPILGHGGLALANTIAVLLEMTFLLIMLAKVIGGLDWGGLWSTVFKTSIASLAMGVALAWMANEFAGGSKYLVGIGGLIVGGLIFLLVAFLLRTPELATLTRLMPGRPRKAPRA